MAPKVLSVELFDERQCTLGEGPVLRTTSCAFAGKNLEKLIITSAERNHTTSTADDGRTYICETGFTGVATTLFAGA